MSDTPQLTDKEIEALRELVKAGQFRKWVVTGVRGVSLWVIGVLAAWSAMNSFILELLK